MSLHAAIVDAQKRRSEVKAELKNVKDKLRRRSSINDNTSRSSTSMLQTFQRCFSQKHQDIATVLYHVDPNGPKVCAAFCCMYIDLQVFLHEHMCEVLTVLKDIPTASSVDLVDKTPWWICQQKDAQELIAKYGLQRWIQKENEQGGIAATTHRVYAAHLEIHLEDVLPNGMALISTHGPFPKRMKQWTRRWARRFNLHRGCLPHCACTSKIDTAAKAPQFQKSRPPKHKAKPTTISFRTQKTEPPVKPNSGRLK